MTLSAAGWACYSTSKAGASAVLCTKGISGAAISGGYSRHRRWRGQEPGPYSAFIGIESIRINLVTMWEILDIVCGEAGHTGPNLLHSLNV